jgi:hypothetical protein
VVEVAKVPVRVGFVVPGQEFEPLLPGTVAAHEKVASEVKMGTPGIDSATVTCPVGLPTASPNESVVLQLWIALARLVAMSAAVFEVAKVPV